MKDCGQLGLPSCDGHFGILGFKIAHRCCLPLVNLD